MGKNPIGNAPEKQVATLTCLSLPLCNKSKKCCKLCTSGKPNEIAVLVVVPLAPGYDGRGSERPLRTAPSGRCAMIPSLLNEGPRCSRALAPMAGLGGAPRGIVHGARARVEPPAGRDAMLDFSTSIWEPKGGKAARATARSGPAATGAR